MVRVDYEYRQYSRGTRDFMPTSVHGVVAAAGRQVGLLGHTGGAICHTWEDRSIGVAALSRDSYGAGRGSASSTPMAAETSAGRNPSP